MGGVRIRFAWPRLDSILVHTLSSLHLSSEYTQFTTLSGLRAQSRACTRTLQSGIFSEGARFGDHVAGWQQQRHRLAGPGYGGGLY